MNAQRLQMPGDVGLNIVYVALRDGEFRCQTTQEVRAACAAMAHRYLTRDPKDGNLFRPGDRAAAVIERARTEGRLPEENLSRVVVTGPANCLAREDAWCAR